VDWIELAQDRDQWEVSCEYGDEPSGSLIAGNFLNGCTLGSFSGRAQLLT
jgi:hypothetical protein